jgi:hypothetical protein
LAPVLPILTFVFASLSMFFLSGSFSVHPTISDAKTYSVYMKKTDGKRQVGANIIKLLSAYKID